MATALAAGLEPAAAPAKARTAASELSLSKPALLRPAFDIVRVEPTGDAVIAGHAAPKAVIELRDDGRVVAEASADASGDFTMLPPPFSAGGHRLELAARTGDAT
ncbi:MAG: peptidoglycan-binding protein, partial [Roseiarcus sp.]